MRLSALFCDVCVFFPCVFLCIRMHTSDARHENCMNGISRGTLAFLHALSVLLQPCAVLIDHGHFQVSRLSRQCLRRFQYMCSITVSAWVFRFSRWSQSAMVLRTYAAVVYCNFYAEMDVVGSVLFCAALNYKQMSLYLAPGMSLPDNLLHACIVRLYISPATVVHL
jgi:alpha-1,3-glucosyltransferase